MAARESVNLAPGSGFAHARVAALEFAFGNTVRARTHLTRALELSPRLASAVALDGFLLAARHRLPEARTRFDQALALDPALADAWLGRGLVRFRSGDRVGARVDIETAAALEPLRGILRSYLAKAFAEEGLDERAFEELGRAQELDPNDPTTPLYSALLHYRRYELAEGIRDLESSVDLNDQRAIYRSRLLLDQDAAVRSANLANLYELADMSDVSRRESARAVMSDYTSHSAHLNLASSYNALRDPTRFNLRNETVWFNEHLLASLLAPTDAAPLSQNLSQNEYSRLFARDRLGLNTTTEYFGSGEWHQLASQVGNSARFSYALDLDYHSKPGFRPNEDFTRIEWYTRAKAQLTPQDSVLFLAKYQEFEGGDLFQYANLSEARTDYRARDSQKPILLAGLHHEWSPGSHTLILAGRLQDRQRVEDLASSQIVAFVNPAQDPLAAPMDIRYQAEFEAYSAEASHILQSEHHTTVAGVRFQSGDFDSTALLDSTPSQAPGVFDPIITTSSNDDFQRSAAYAYHTWEILPDLRLTGGLSYDRITSPRNFRRPPLASGENETSQWSPKAALVYAPTAAFAVRGLYTESLGGVSYDESIRLEPTQLAGFPQSFRTLISESLIGSVESPRHRSAGLGIDLRLPSRTYLSTEATWLDSRVDQDLGYFAFDTFRPFPEALAVPVSTTRTHRYSERGARVIANQILAEEWFVQGAYQFTRSSLDSSFPNLPATPTFERMFSSDADLHTLRGSLLYQRADGWFSRFTTIWHRQENPGPAPATDEDFAQLNLFVGYRFPRHLGELTVGVLNLTDRNYGLSPLTPYDELPRERMVYVRLRLQL
jgi:outer membrane receptor protein involved in Fe transport